MPDNLEFELPDPSYAAYTWILSDEHTPVAAPPLTGEMFAFGGRSGELVPRSLRLNGYTYQRHGTGPGVGDPPWAYGTPPSSVEQMRRWRAEWQPEVDKVVEALTSFDPARVAAGSWRRTLDGQMAEYWRVFGPVHREAVMPAHAIGHTFEQAYVRRFGESRRADAHALLQGMPNASLERAALLWDLSRLVRAELGLLMRSSAPVRCRIRRRDIASARACRCCWSGSAAPTRASSRICRRGAKSRASRCRRSAPMPASQTAAGRSTRPDARPSGARN